jgi:hypothetical protein
MRAAMAQMAGIIPGSEEMEEMDKGVLRHC